MFSGEVKQGFAKTQTGVNLLNAWSILKTLAGSITIRDVHFWCWRLFRTNAAKRICSRTCISDNVNSNRSVGLYSYSQFGFCSGLRELALLEPRQDIAV